MCDVAATAPTQRSDLLDDLLAEVAAGQERTETEGRYSEEVHRHMSELGLYRLIVPHIFGGAQAPVSSFFDIVMRLSRACPSTGWMYCLGAGHAIVAAALFDEEAQRELFAETDFIAPATVIPSGQSARGDEGRGWHVSGVWRFCSGAPYAHWLLAHTVPGGEEEPILVAVPRSDFVVEEDWKGVHGLRGSGSNSIRVDGAQVPDRLAFHGHLATVPADATTPGEVLHGSPMYGGRIGTFLVLEDAALAIGMASGGLDIVDKGLRSRRSLLDPKVALSSDPDYQRLFGEAACLIHTARAAFATLVREFDDATVRWDAQIALRHASVCREIVRLAWTAVEGRLMPLAGTGSLRVGASMERLWRDLSMQHSHAGIAVYLGATVPGEWARNYWGEAAA